MEDKKNFLSTSTFVDNVVRRIFGETVQNKTTSKLHKWLYELFETGEGGEIRRIIGKMKEIEQLLDLLEENIPEKRQELIETMNEIREWENHADEERDLANWKSVGLFLSAYSFYQSLCYFWHIMFLFDSW